MPKKVLLIEYEPRYVERIRTLLNALGHAVTEVHDGEAGLTAFAGSRFDLVLLSGMLPRLPSAEVIRDIRKKGGATAPPIILMMSGYRGSNRKADAQKVGAFDILVRPFADEDLLASVRDALDSVDVGSKTMRIDTSQLAEVTPLTSSDIFADVLDDLAEPQAPAPPAAASRPAPPPPAEDAMERRLRDTLSGLNLKGSVPAARPGPADRTPLPSAPAASSGRLKLSSDTDVDKILSDTLSGITLPRPKAPPVSGATPAPRRREEPAAAVASTGPDRFGQYEILERIAAGGMAEVYKAKRTGVEGFQKIVAIKKILPHIADDEGFVTMFADEAKLAAQLNHPNIIHIYDLGKIQAGGYFIAMEYVDGRDLRAIQQAGGQIGVPLPVSLAVYIASKVASALDYAHRRRDAEGHELNIVHRDVSPQNILISYEGEIKLCDFGIAKAASKASHTQSGALKGKMQYMSPEQAWGKAIDRRSDLFSLGVVLHELLTGERLFRGDTDIAILEKVRNADVPPPSRVNPEVPHNLDAVVLKALAKDPEERYANASDLLRDLDSVLYSYAPAPGGADVAIYLHRLQAEESAMSEAKAREAAQAAHDAEPAARKRKSKGAPVSRKTGTPRAAEPPAAPPPAPPRAPAPAPPPRESEPPAEVFGSMTARSAETANRTPLFIAIGAAALLLAAFAVWKMTRPEAPTTAPAPVVPTAAAASPSPEPAPAVAPTAPAMDPKAVEVEVQRQLAARRKDLEKAAVAARKPTAVVAPAAEAAPPPLPEPTLVPPTAVPTAAPTAVPTPQPEPTEPIEPPPVASVARASVTSSAAAPAPVRETEVQRGDLVGPGPGVVEPTLISQPRVVYPPMARQQRVSGRVVVLVLVAEDGKVVESRLQQGIAGQGPVNEAVVAAIRNVKFRAATKNGIAVRMWRPVVVEVRP